MKTNTERAQDVLPLVEALAERWGSDCLEQCIRDLVTNLGHLHDRLHPQEREEGEPGFDDLLHQARGMLQIERDEDEP